MTGHVDWRGTDRVLLRLYRPSPRLPTGWSVGPWAACVAIHTVAIAFVASIEAPPNTIVPAARLQAPATLTWVSTRAVPRPASARQSGGGGGGDKRPARAASTHALDPGRPERLEPLPLSALPLTTIAFSADVPDIAAAGRSVAAAAQSTGAHEGRGEGSGGGFGTGEGTGFGAGVGPGVGPGSGGGTGGGVYRPGGGVTTPIVVTKVLPMYPEDAVRSGAQGSVTLQAIVRCTGIPDSITVVHPVDRGPLDREAERAVRQWRFQPGTLDGVPVDVLVTVIVDFVLY